MNDTILLLFGLSFDTSIESWKKVFNIFFRSLNGAIFYIHLISTIRSNILNFDHDFKSYFILISDLISSILLITAHHLIWFYFNQIDSIKNKIEEVKLRKGLSNNCHIPHINFIWIYFISIIILINDGVTVTENYMLIMRGDLLIHLSHRLVGVVVEFYESGFIVLILFLFIELMNDTNLASDEAVSAITRDEDNQSHLSSIRVALIKIKIEKYIECHRMRIKFYRIFTPIIFILIIYSFISCPEILISIFANYISFYEYFFFIAVKTLIVMLTGYISILVTINTVKSSRIKSRLIKLINDAVKFTEFGFQKDSLISLSKSLINEGEINSKFCNLITFIIISIVFSLELMILALVVE